MDASCRRILSKRTSAVHFDIVDALCLFINHISHGRRWLQVTFAPLQVLPVGTFVAYKTLFLSWINAPCKIFHSTRVRAANGEAAWHYRIRAAGIKVHIPQRITFGQDADICVYNIN